MDYRVRGFTRDVDGKKLFMDREIRSIQDYISKETLRRYDVVDINVYEANLFHTKMMLKEIDLQNYLFKTDVYELPPTTRLSIMDSLRREMIEIDVYKRQHLVRVVSKDLMRLSQRQKRNLVLAKRVASRVCYIF